MSINEFMSVCRCRKPARVRVWDHKHWRVTLDGYIKDSDIVNADNEIISNFDALEKYHVVNVDIDDGALLIDMVINWQYQ